MIAVECQYSGMAKVIIAGGRDFNNSKLLGKKVSLFLFDISYDNIVVISGGARGADTLGGQWARSNHIPVVTYHADWEKDGRKAGYLRNIEMATNATHCIVFWDGKSKGSKHMIDTAKKYNLILKVVIY